MGFNSGFKGLSYRVPFRLHRPLYLERRSVFLLYYVTYQKQKHVSESSKALGQEMEEA